ncbi:MAG: trehalose-phosphatase, partial [Acidimicrobiales bacterium]
MRSSQEALDWLCLDPAATALLTDFDGTLSPIVVEPDSAYPLPGAVEALESLSAQLGAVAVVSGRPASFLVDHLGLSTDSAIDLFGLHGVEHVVAGHLEVAEA